MKNPVTRTSYLNIYAADSWDVWPLDDATGYMLVVFLNGFSSMVSSHEGPCVWADEQSAVNYLTELRPDLPRHRCDPGPR